MDHHESVKNIPLESAQLSDAGLKRSKNEDWVTGFEPNNPLELQQSGCLYIVADGVGGAKRGERASKYAAERVLYSFFQETDLEPAFRLSRAMKSVCKEIYDYAQDNNLSRMATTMVAANIRENILTIANVGDSRCYLLRSGKMVQITEDHNLAAELVRNGTYTEEEVKHVKSGNTLLRSIGGDPEVDVDVFGQIDLFPGDLILLCSDGLTRYLDKDTLIQLCEYGSAEQISRRLIDFANSSGGADNVSVYVIKVEPESQTRNIDEDITIPAKIITESDNQFHRDERRTIPPQKLPLNRGNFINIGLSALLFLLILFGVIFLSKKNKALPIDTRTVIPTEPTMQITDLPIRESTIQPTPKINVTENAAYVQPTQTNVHSITDTPMPEATQPAVVTQPNKFCIHQIKEGEVLVTILPLYDLVYDKAKNYQYFLKCDIEQKNCLGQPITINEPESIGIGWFLIIPEVTEEKCIMEKNGNWITVNP